MRPFAYARPERLEDVLALLQAEGRRAAVLAGGTDLVVALREGTMTPSTVVDIKHIAELSPAIGIAAGHLRIGGTAVMATVERDELVRSAFPALAAAARVVGSVQIRNRATVAGNICHASPAADTAPPLLVYRAVVNSAGAAGMRRVPLSDFFVGPGQTALEPGELVTSVDLPLDGQVRASAFARITRRRGVDLATVNGACAVEASGHTRLAFGSVGPRPILVIDESGTLADPAAPQPAKQRVLTRLLEMASPISDVRAGAAYRAAMLEVLSRRLLRDCLGSLQPDGATSGDGAVAPGGST